MNEFKDHVVQNPDKFIVTDNPDGTKTIKPFWVENPTDILQAGTPFNAAAFNAIPAEIAAIDEKVTSQLAETTKRAVETVSHKIDKNIIVSFVDDDGHNKIMSILKPIFEAENVPCTVAIITDRLDKNATHITTAQAKELMAMGWTVCSHTHTHPMLGTLTEEQNEFEIKTSKEIVDSIGGDGDILVYPFGSASDVTRKVTRKYSRLGLGGYNFYNKMPLNTYTLGRFTDISENVFDLNACKTIVDNAPANSWLIFYTHVNYDMWLDPATATKMRQLIQHIKSKSIDIVNVKEGLERKGNVVDTGDDKEFFKVGRDGSTLSNPFHKEGITLSTPITDFPKGETDVSFSNAQATTVGLPENVGGILTTYRVPYSSYSIPDIYSYQTYQLYWNSKLYRRRWDTNTSAWTSFELVTQDFKTAPIHYFDATRNAYNGTQLITAFPESNITTFWFDGTNATGMPTNAGVCTTYRMRSGSTAGWDRQECRQYNGDKIWNRYVKSDGTWTTWQQVSRDTEYHAVKIGANPYGNATPLTDFPQNVVTTFFYNSPGSAGFPVSAGIVTTYRMSDDAWGKQELREYRANGVWSRYWDGTVWSTWTKISVV